MKLARHAAWMAVAAGLAAAPALCAQSDIADAQRAYVAGRYAEARMLWEPLAEAGDPQAQLGLATLLDVGEGGARDAAAANRWYRRAAEFGLPEAEFNVAVMTDGGDGVARDAAAAALWYARAAAHGSHRAQYNLALLYLAGDGVPRNPEQAEEWFRAAAISLPAAMDKLSELRRIARRVQAPKSQPLTPVQLAAPADGSTLAASGRPIELVWTAPAQATAIRFFVQVIALDDAREAFTADLDETATLANLGPATGRYAWRVYSVARDTRRYAASEWARFEIAAPE